MACKTVTIGEDDSGGSSNVSPRKLAMMGVGSLVGGVAISSMRNKKNKSKKRRNRNGGGK